MKVKLVLRGRILRLIEAGEGGADAKRRTVRTPAPLKACELTAPSVLRHRRRQGHPASGRTPDAVRNGAQAASMVFAGPSPSPSPLLHSFCHCRVGQADRSSGSPSDRRQRWSSGGESSGLMKRAMLGRQYSDTMRSWL